MKRNILTSFFLVLFASGTIVTAQVTSQEEGLRKQQSDTVVGWKYGGKIGLSFSQVSLTNWAAGGNNSVSGIGNINLYLNHAGERSLWINTLILGYGKQNIQGDVTKTDDRILFTSKYGRKISGSLYYAGMIDFKTQMDAGYSSADKALKISNFMAPAYLFASLGIDFTRGENLSLYFAPVTSKSTFVLDQMLSDSGSFGLDPGEKFRAEFGGYLKFQYKMEVMKNVAVATRLDLFSNYLDKPGNIDVDWGLDIDMTVNKYLSVTISTNLIYDDDIKFGYDSNGDDVIDAYGPKVQFKELLGVGLTFAF